MKNIRKAVNRSRHRCEWFLANRPPWCVQHGYAACGCKKEIEKENE